MSRPALCLTGSANHDADSSVSSLVDALPYIDGGYDEEPGVKEAVFALIEEETKRYKLTKNYLEHMPTTRIDLYETELMKQEMERIAAGKRMDLLNMRRYELPAPPPGRLTDTSAWSEAVDNSHSQLEHQLNRITNLKLLEKYGAEAWKVSNSHLNNMVQAIQKELLSVRKLVQEVNWQRKSAQTAAGEKLTSLQETWNGLVNKNYEIESACLLLQSEIDRLEKTVPVPHNDENDVNHVNQQPQVQTHEQTNGSEMS